MRFLGSLIILVLLQAVLIQAKPITKTSGKLNVPKDGRTAAIISRENKDVTVQSIADAVSQKDEVQALRRRETDDKDEDGDEHVEEMQKNKEEDEDENEDDDEGEDDEV